MTLNPVLLVSLEEKKRRLDRLRPFPPAAMARLRQQMVVEWTFNSNAIEGNTLTLKETALVLQEGITIAGKPLREHLEAVNHREAIVELERLVKKNASLSEGGIQSLHRIILRGIDDLEGGRYRIHRVRIIGARHIPPDPVKVPREMQACLAWYHREEKNLHPVELAAVMHHKLVGIHPFIDGNGRCARLVMNLILMRHGYPPAVILKVDRRTYYRRLQEADQERHEGWVAFIGRAVERSLIIYLQALAPAGTKEYARQGYVTLAEAAKRSPYSQEYLSLLARRGRLSAVKFGRNWMTTHDAVAEYLM